MAAGRGLGRASAAVWAVALAVLVLHPAPAPAMATPEGPRRALLVGVSDYALPGLDLRNPANDVAALGEVLEDLGFEVTRLVDPTLARLRRALDTLADPAQPAALRLVFFAGHAIQLSGENYLLAADVQGTTIGQVVERSMTLTAIRDSLARAGTGTSVVILDACREIPPVGAAVVPPPGLAAPDRGFPGFLIAYATDPGNVASDGTGRNSVFTEALLAHLPTPGLDLRLAFGRVRQHVVRATEGAQVPWVEESLLGELRLVPGPAPGAGAGARDEIALWQRLSRTGGPEAMRRYLSAHPEGLFAELARMRLARAQDAPMRADTSAPPDTALAAVDDPQARLRLATALTVLGHPVAERPPSRRALAQALAAWRARTGTDRAPDPAHLLAEAARTVVLLGAYSGRRLRVDMAALESIERVRGVAAEATREIARLSDGRPEHRAALAEARGQLAEIDRAREAVLARLDRSREFYALQVRRAAGPLRDQLGMDATAAPQGRGAPEPDLARGGEIRDDVARFLAHVRLPADPDRRGTLAWLADFLPG